MRVRGLSSRAVCHALLRLLIPPSLSVMVPLDQWFEDRGEECEPAVKVCGKVGEKRNSLLSAGDDSVKIGPKNTISNILLSSWHAVLQLFKPTHYSPIEARIPPSISGLRGTGTTLNTTISSTPVRWKVKNCRVRFELTDVVDKKTPQSRRGRKVLLRHLPLFSIFSVSIFCRPKNALL